MTKYEHLFKCPKCDALYSWVDDHKIGKKATWFNSCFNCGIVKMEFYKTENRRIKEK